MFYKKNRSVNNQFEGYHRIQVETIAMRQLPSLDLVQCYPGIIYRQSEPLRIELSHHSPITTEMIQMEPHHSKKLIYRKLSFDKFRFFSNGGGRSLQWNTFMRKGEAVQNRLNNRWKASPLMLWPSYKKYDTRSVCVKQFRSYF